MSLVSGEPFGDVASFVEHGLLRPREHSFALISGVGVLESTRLRIRLVSQDSPAISNGSCNQREDVVTRIKAVSGLLTLRRTFCVSRSECGLEARCCQQDPRDRGMAWQNDLYVKGSA